jgi:hypothetical protein
MDGFLRAPRRVCKFENLCWAGGRFVYYRNPEIAKLVVLRPLIGFHRASVRSFVHFTPKQSQNNVVTFLFQDLAVVCEP